MTTMGNETGQATTTGEQAEPTGGGRGCAVKPAEATSPRVAAGAALESAGRMLQGLRGMNDELAQGVLSAARACDAIGPDAAETGPALLALAEQAARDAAAALREIINDCEAAISGADVAVRHLRHAVEAGAGAAERAARR